MIGAIAVCLYLLFAVWAYRTITRRADDDEEPEELPTYDTAQMEGEVNALYDEMRKLRELDEMMIDLRLCSPDEMQRGFRIEWQSVGGQNHRFDFLADGASESTEHLMQLAQAERDAVNDAITRRINVLYYRASSLDAVCKTSAKRSEEGSEYGYN